MRASYKAVIYDCDGVMFDSFEANFAFYQRILAHFGKPPLDRNDGETMRVLHTYANADVMAYLFAGDDRRAEAQAFAGTINYGELVHLMFMEENFRETLTALQPLVHLAVCTNRSTSVDMVLESFDLSRYFSYVMTAAKVARPKPYPDPLLKVLDFYGIEPQQALFVGDSEVDRLAAEAAGVPFLAYKADMPALARLDRHDEILSFFP
ncbi:HAD family hydrolase [Geotalea toluenoxydans]|uniref:HAD family hydrolase n=1 Tax=Geotalea toluenoxydans TaxID=421624 RepID=UPI000ABF5629|nr:HAD family hydrolase [Geotalea toluenoxydans]